MTEEQVVGNGNKDIQGGAPSPRAELSSTHIARFLRKRHLLEKALTGSTHADAVMLSVQGGNEELDREFARAPK